MMKLLLSTIVSLMALAMPVVAEEPSPFRFEDYPERTAFTEAVNSRFPVGSSYLGFKKQVIAAGAEAEQNILETPKNEHVFTKTERPVVSTNFLKSWSIAVTEQNDKLTFVSPTFTRSGKDETDE